MRKRHRQQGSDVNHRCLHHSLIGYHASRIPCLHVLPLGLTIRKSRYIHFTSLQDRNQLLVLVHLPFVSTASSIRLSTSGSSPRFNTTTMSCRFLALPAELRQRIYTFIFQGPAVMRTYTPEQKRRYLYEINPRTNGHKDFAQTMTYCLPTRPPSTKHLCCITISPQSDSHSAS